MFVLGLVLFVIGGASLACRFLHIARRVGGHVRVWPAWWDQIDQWRDEA